MRNRPDYDADRAEIDALKAEVKSLRSDLYTLSISSIKVTKHLEAKVNRLEEMVDYAKQIADDALQPRTIGEKCI